jgi:hypothetical protein
VSNFCFCYRALLDLYFEMGHVFICNITVNCTLYVLVQSEYSTVRTAAKVQIRNAFDSSIKEEQESSC